MWMCLMRKMAGTVDDFNAWIDASFATSHNCFKLIVRILIAYSTGLNWYICDLWFFSILTYHENTLWPFRSRKFSNSVLEFYLKVQDISPQNGIFVDPEKDEVSKIVQRSTPIAAVTEDVSVSFSVIFKSVANRRFEFCWVVPLTDYMKLCDEILIVHLFFSKKWHL